MNSWESNQLAVSRRCFLAQGGFGLGAAALASLLPGTASGIGHRQSVVGCQSCLTCALGRSGPSICS